MVNHLFTQSFTEKSVELELCFLQFLLPPLLADWSQSEGEWLAKGWCATNIRITLCNIFVFHNVHHARWINPSVINCYCVLVRNVGTLHVTTPEIIVCDPTQVWVSHWGGRTRNCQSWALRGGLPSHTGSPTIHGVPAGGFLLTHTLQQALGHGCPVNNTPLPEDGLQVYCYQSPTQRSSFPFFPFLLKAASLILFAMATCTCQFSGILLANIQDCIIGDVILGRKIQKKLKHVGFHAGVSWSVTRQMLRSPWFHLSTIV